MEEKPSTTTTAAANANNKTMTHTCPRCHSSNTKFCYYNNYSLSQPRHFCKACKRYWTRGGTLRNVPVGGGCRKNKRASKKPSLVTAQPHRIPSLTTLQLPNPTPQLDGSLMNNPLFYPSSSSDMSALFPNLIQPHIGDGYQIGGQLQQLDLGDDYLPIGSSISSSLEESLLMSSLKQPKREENYQAFMQYDNSQGLAHAIAPIDQSFLYWNSGSSNWPESSNYGSSLAPLI
ncbi:uncharacterized protein [Typha latifolia]|uniref:uncharacterized protein n=1 Tax=Typha latifolia TaxID=4733 RepID=UPI003C2ED778